MGWLNEAFPGHEGYVVALIEHEPGSSFYQELAYPSLPPGACEDEIRTRGYLLRRIAVGCDCGWRSPHMRAPAFTHWYPRFVELPNEHHEDLARAIWHAHIESFAGQAYSSVGDRAELEDLAPKTCLRAGSGGAPVLVRRRR